MFSTPRFAILPSDLLMNSAVPSDPERFFLAAIHLLSTDSLSGFIPLC